MRRQKNAFKPNPNGLVAGLIRKSKVEYPPECVTEQERDTYDAELIQIRKDEISQMAAADGLTIDRFYIDMGVSGRAHAMRLRAGLTEFLEASHERLIRILYIRDMSRVIRDVDISRDFRRDMERIGVELRYPSKVATGNATMDDMIYTLQAFSDQMQAEQTGDWYSARNYTAVKSGKWIGRSRPALGFLYDANIKGWLPNPETIPIIRRVFEVIVDLHGNTRAAARLLNNEILANDINAVYPPYAKLWNAACIIDMVTSPVYRRQIDYLDEIFDAKELVPEILPIELVTKAQELIASRSRKDGNGRVASPPSRVYTNFLYCALCGGVCHTGGSLRAPVYICHNRTISTQLCPAFAVAVHRLETLFTEILANLPTSQITRTKPIKQTTIKINNIKADLERLDAETERAKKLYVEGIDTIETLKRRLSIIDKQRIDLNESNKSAEPEVSPEQIAEILGELIAGWKSDNDPRSPRKRALLSKLKTRIEMRVEEREHTKLRPWRNQRPVGGCLTLTVTFGALGITQSRTETEEEYKDRCAWYK